MTTFVTPDGERVEAVGAMAKLYRRRGWREADTTGPVSAADPPPRPAKGATRAEWAEYYSQGAKVDPTGMTRAAIIEAVEGLH